jgi:hypothetical protein
MHEQGHWFASGIAGAKTFGDWVEPAQQMNFFGD